MAIGEIDGIETGAAFECRKALHEAGIHRPMRAGIAGAASVGAESIILSGGYVDDKDYGDELIYTGHGGRDAKSGRQVADQEFTRQNQALVISCLQGLPVRVVRGAGHLSPFSPITGYRYDGLYWVDQYWKEQGADGFIVCRFRLLSDPGLRGEIVRRPSESEGTSTKRVKTTILRIVRDTELGRRVKRMYGFRCQICGVQLECEGGPYAEAAHIRPLGRPHDGPDALDNLLCLCPNHHVLFDNGGLVIQKDLGIVGIVGSSSYLQVRDGHQVSEVHLDYHRSMWM